MIEFIERIAQNNSCKQTIIKKLLENEIIKQTVMKLTELLEKSIRMRVQTQPQRCKDCLFLDEASCCHSTVGVLFSGGLDCTILAYLADKYLPKNQSIDLINVAFDRQSSQNYNVPDRLTGDMSFVELKRLCPNR